MSRFLIVLALPLVATAVLNVKNSNGEEACAAEDLKRRVLLQNKLAGICEGMCKEVQAAPAECTCPNYVEPDSTPGVMTWEELLGYMDQLAAWGKDTIKGWHKQASQLQVAKNATAAAKSTTAKVKATNATQATTGAVMNLKARQLMEVTVGGFETAESACDYCFTSFTKEGKPPAGPVATACVCMAYPEGPADYNMFCATPVSAAEYVQSKQGCRCKARDMENQGQTSCKPI